ncbi:MAG: polysaccharide biosynthesis tyrosine autokinase [Candidatus Hydrogenedentes bacterium]|nr:polysaccharide biosynthesis tyrosine autokinase [Candidatus Hydrogenedentota bacterium]
MASTASEIEKHVNRRNENQFRFVLNVLYHQWYVVFGGALLGALLFGAFGLLQFERQTLYVAETELFVEPSMWETIPLNAGGYPGSQPVNSNPRTIAPDIVKALVRQDVIAGETWSRLATEEEYQAAADDIAASLEIEFDDKTNVVSIACTRDTEAEATSITEFAARALIQNHHKTQIETQREKLAFVQAQLEQIQRELEEKEREEWQFREAMGFRQHDRIVERLDAWNEELVEAETTREQLEARLESVKARLQNMDEELPGALGQVTDAVVKDLLQELDELVSKQLSMSIQYTDVYPPLQDLREDIADKKLEILRALEQLERGVDGGSALWKEREDLSRRYRELQLDIMSLDTRMAAIQTLLRERREDLPELADLNFEHQRLLRAVEKRRSEFDKLLDIELDLRTSMDRGHAELTRQMPVRTRSMRMQNISLAATITIGALAGLLAGLGAAIMIEMNDTSIKSIDDVTEFIGVEVIGTIPYRRFDRKHGGGGYKLEGEDEAMDAAIVTLHNPKSPVSEAYRTLRTRFQLATIDQKPRTVLVTSAVPAEGKTTTAVNMAVAFADSGMRVLLMDGDMRRPNVHRVLRMERSPGVVDLLRENLDPHSIVRPTHIENLWMASSGQVPPNPSELIGSDKMRQLMRDLGEEFDLVLCDAPSLLVVTDPVLLAKDVDTVVLVIRAKYARRETIAHAKKLLETANGSIAGVVLNGLATSRRHYYAAYYDEDANEYREQRWFSPR